eukprot:g26280.t1
MNADVAKALNKDDDSVDDEPEDEENDSDAESTSSFGLEQDDEAAKPAKRRRTKETTAANTKPTEAVARVPKPEIPGSSTKDDTPRPKVKAKASAASGKEEKLTRAQKAKQDRADRCYSTATKAFTAIKEISTDMVWRSVIRTGEVERRVQKCYQAHAELEAQVAEGQFAGNAEVAAVCEEMPKRALLLTQTKDLCKGIRGSTPDSMAKDVATCGEVSTLFLTVFGSVVSDIPSTNDMLQTAIGDVPKAVQILKDSCKSESIDLEDIVKSISNFESIGSALNNDFIQKNTFFQSLVESFTEFRGAFLDSVKVAVKSFEDAHLAIFQQFLDKYECVLPAAEKWQMQPVASFFNENQDETREALDQIIAAKSNAAGPMKALSQFCSHSTSCKDFKELIQQCGQLHKRTASRRLKAALLNPLPPLGLAPELRAEVLTAGGPERLRLVRRGLETSLGHLQALAKSPLRRYCLWIFRLPAPVAMTAVMVCACLISAIFPAKE